MSKVLKIGVLIKAHGILGEILIRYYADSVELLSGAVLLGRSAESAVPIVIERSRYNREKLLIQIQGVTTRTEAEKLRGYFLFIDSLMLPSLGEGEVYRFSLYGFSLYSGDDYIGVLEEIQDISGQEIWFIRGERGEEILFPAVDEFIECMDFEGGRIYIRPPSGLLEVYKKV